MCFGKEQRSRIVNSGSWTLDPGSTSGFCVRIVGSEIRAPGSGPRYAGFEDHGSILDPVLGSWNTEQVLGVPVLSTSHRTAPIGHGPPFCTLADLVPGHRAPARRGHPVLAQDVRREHVGRQVQQGVQVQHPAFVWPGREAGELSAKEVREGWFLVGVFRSSFSIHILNPHPQTHTNSARTALLGTWPWP